MFEREEEKLTNHKNSYDNIDIPLELLDDAIVAGFQKAKVEKKRRPRAKKWMLSVAAAILFIGFFTSVRLSPAFAEYVAVIPGMEKLVELIRFDKGKLQAIQHDYYEEINVSQEKNGLAFTVDGAIADEESLVLFYSLESLEKQKELTIEEVHLERFDGKKLDFGSYSGGRDFISQDGETTFNDMFEYHFHTPLKERSFRLRVKVKKDRQTEEYLLQFQLKKDIQKKKTIKLDKTVTIEGEKITFVTAEIYPLRVAVHVKMDPANTKKLLEFEDLHIVDEQGQTWNKIANGVTASRISDDEAIIYLQSNYFNEPKELYIILNKIQAVDKEDANIIIDTQNKQILKQPEGNLLTNLIVEGTHVGFKIDTKEEFNYHLISGAKDRNGNEIENPETSMSRYEGQMEIGIHLPRLTPEMSPISLELSFYPSWIEGEGKIRIK
ncbi:DUF4179 domain-containing protein [Bacillus sp. OK048]|uniref:DUF4179 domain-containing protein n=1 Tax=Bacillus sp. OK048 TaxID=1882761 RepID=UPI0020C8337F|nr:DUF4179 domain-containing protein [Bacillus sp. OK048]